MPVGTIAAFGPSELIARSGARVRWSSSVRQTLCGGSSNTPVPEIDNEATVEDKEELIIVVVLMP